MCPDQGSNLQSFGYGMTLQPPEPPTKAEEVIFDQNDGNNPIHVETFSNRENSTNKDSETEFDA